MELEEIVLWADIVQAVAVVATLLFVGFQVRYSTRIARMTAAQTSAQLLSQNLGRVTDSPDLAELLSGSRGDFDDLTPGERLRISNFLAAGFRHLEVLHAHRRYDIYEEELWEGSAGRMRMMLSNPRIEEWWLENAKVYAISFQKFVATELETIQTNPPEA